METTIKVGEFYVHRHIPELNRQQKPDDHPFKIQGYAMDDYEVLVNKIRKLPQSDRDVRKFIREFFSNTEECHLDSQGRILIPQHLRDYAGISKNLVTKGAMDKIEIWSTEVLADPEGENMMDNEEFVRKLDMYDL